MVWVSLSETTGYGVIEVWHWVVLLHRGVGTEAWRLLLRVTAGFLTLLVA